RIVGKEVWRDEPSIRVLLPHERRPAPRPCRGAAARRTLERAWVDRLPRRSLRGPDWRIDHVQGKRPHGGTTSGRNRPVRHRRSGVRTDAATETFNTSRWCSPRPARSARTPPATVHSTTSLTVA